MKKLATYVFVVAGLTGTPAFAADIPVKAPPPPPAPVYSWAGWYVGGNVGYSWGRANTDLTGNGNFAVIVPAGVLAASSFAFGDSDTARPNGMIGGGQIGYNYQFSQSWVLGFEADIQGSGERGAGQFANTFDTLGCFPNPGIGPPICLISGSTTALTSYEAKIDWFETVRGRLGVVVGNEFLVYATGGLAYGKVAVSGSTNVTPFPVTTANQSFAASKTNVGFAVGGGIEGRLSHLLPPNWTVKLEYLYLDLGSFDTATSLATTTVLDLRTVEIASANISTHTHFTDNIVRVGLNYQFH